MTTADDDRGHEAGDHDPVLAFAHIGDLHLTDAKQRNFTDFLAIVAQIEIECARSIRSSPLMTPTETIASSPLEALQASRLRRRPDPRRGERAPTGQRVGNATLRPLERWNGRSERRRRAPSDPKERP